MYMHASDAANQVKGVKQFYFGGPATTSYYEAWIQSVLSSGNRADFISWHVYDPRPKTIASHMEKYTALLALHPSFGQIPVYITEYGHTGEKSPLYSTAYEAVYTAAVVRQLMDATLKPQLFAFQLKDATDDTNGWGMIAHESKGAVLKPRYYVFSFLDRMKGKRVSVSGEGSSVTGYASIDRATTRLMLINIDPENQNGTHPQNVPITFSHLLAGEYTLKRSKFLGKEITSSFSISSDSAELSIYMPANSMEILEVAKVSK